MDGSPYAVPPSERIPCARCAALVHAREADYSPMGEVLCLRCAKVGDIDATEKRAVSHMTAAGYGNLGLGVMALIFNPVFLFSIITIANAVLLTSSMVRGDWYRRRMGGHYVPVIASAIVGGVLGSVPLVVWPIMLGAG